VLLLKEDLEESKKYRARKMYSLPQKAFYFFATIKLRPMDLKLTNLGIGCTAITAELTLQEFLLSIGCCRQAKSQNESRNSSKQRKSNHHRCEDLEKRSYSTNI
jgi:hypothetical protein